MKHKHAIGIDVSKETLDVVCHLNAAHIQVENTPSGFKKMLAWVKRQVKGELDQTLFCFEHTGLYRRELTVFCHAQQVWFGVESPVYIKRSLGPSATASTAAHATRTIGQAASRTPQHAA